MEQKLKLQIGEMVVTIVSLQDQLEQANAKIAELEASVAGSIAPQLKKDKDEQSSNS